MTRPARTEAPFGSVVAPAQDTQLRKRTRSVGLVAGVVVGLAAGRALAETPPLHFQHPPAGVVAAHTIGEGRVAIGYAYQRTRYEQMRDERDRISATEVLATTSYESAPRRVEVERHDLSLMVAPIDRITLMANLPIIRKSMDNETRTGSFATHASGVGDLEVTGIARFMKRGAQETFVSLGVAVPTGSIRERGNTPLGRQRLPYPMQLGAGVWSLNPGLSYRGQRERLSWGGQALSRIYLGKNDLKYRPGDHYRVTAWVGGRWTDFMVTSFRAEWQHWGNVEGRDRALDLNSTPVANPMEQKGERLDLGEGIDLHWPGIEGKALEFEVTLPMWEQLDGPQPSFDWRIRAGLRWAL